MRTTSQQTVGEIALANPDNAKVFETPGIDDCCGGTRSLTAACERANVPAGTFVGLLNDGILSTNQGVPNDAPLSDLTRRIVERQHASIRRESLRIQGLLIRVCDKHGRAHAELSDLALGDKTGRPACFGSVESACPAYQALYRPLEAFERDLHWHDHLENNILFPRAIAAERDQRNRLACANPL